MSLVQELGVNGLVICDCGHREFRIGVTSDAKGNSFIRLLECTKCEHEMIVPFRSFSTSPPGPVVESENVLLREESQ